MASAARLSRLHRAHQRFLPGHAARMKALFLVARASASIALAWSRGATPGSKKRGRGAPVAPRIDWSRHAAVHRDAPRLPRRSGSASARPRWSWRGGAVRAAHVRDHRLSITATFRIAPSGPRAPPSSCSRCSAHRPCSAARSGGLRTTATTTRTPTSRATALAAAARLPCGATSGWFLSRGNFATAQRAVGPARFPELRFLDRFDIAGAGCARALLLRRALR